VEYLALRECQRAVVAADWFTPDVLPAGYRDYFAVEVDPFTRRWVIDTGAYVGILPLTPDYGLQILPKSGLTNLTYMLYRSGLLNRSLETPFDQTVPYQVPEDDLESFFEGLIHSFLRALDIIKAWGLMREGILVDQHTAAIRGKINYLGWARDIPRSGGLPVPQRVFSPQIDNLPNRVLRRCLEYLAQSPLKYVKQTEVLGRLEYFGQIPSPRISAEELAELEQQLEAGRFPAGRYYYLPALNLALLILRGAGLALGDDHDVTFKPILINTAIMFEKYVRAICQEAAQGYDAHVEDGKQSPLPFYKESPAPVNVQPDILVRRGGNTLIVMDVKYKFAPTAQDHYQMWAYMHAHQVMRGGFINVADVGVRSIKNPARFRRDQYDVFEYAFDCRQIKTAEQALVAMMARQLESALA
jgi:5-methylcytosine-specific restriction endonuclease McrBC regulatory subunit McrC